MVKETFACVGSNPTSSCRRVCPCFCVSPEFAACTSLVSRHFLDSTNDSFWPSSNGPRRMDLSGNSARGRQNGWGRGGGRPRTRGNGGYVAAAGGWPTNEALPWAGTAPGTRGCGGGRRRRNICLAVLLLEVGRQNGVGGKSRRAAGGCGRATAGVHCRRTR